MKKILIGTLVFLIIGCSTAVITGRKQLIIVDKDEVIEQSYMQYESILQDNKILENADADMVKKVGVKISKAVEQFLDSKPKYAHLDDGFNWEFNLLESDQINAWCMPGGKVAFYSGILDYTNGEDGIAVVMGHEIAHAIADHGRERMSQELVKQYGGSSLSKVFEENPVEASDLFLSAYGATSDLVTLKYGRDHEKEADKLGVIFMSLAGYDPMEAILFWERMAADKVNEPLEFFSTHPNSDTRIELIKEYIKSEEFKEYTR